jgi:hypothetical protein
MYTGLVVPRSYTVSARPGTIRADDQIQDLSVTVSARRAPAIRGPPATRRSRVKRTSMRRWLRDEGAAGEHHEIT